MLVERLDHLYVNPFFEVWKGVADEFPALEEFTFYGKTEDSWTGDFRFAFKRDTAGKLVENGLTYEIREGTSWDTHFRSTATDLAHRLLMSTRAPRIF